MTFIFENNARIIPITQKYWQSQLKLYLDKKIKNNTMFLPYKLEFKPIDKVKYSQIPYVIAIDTETFNSNGNLICLCNSENNDTLYGTPEKIPSISEIYDYLFKLNNNKANTLFIAYNLKFDASILLKSLTVNLEEFYNQEFELTVDNIKIKYLHKKALSLRRGNTTIIIFDAFQFFLGAGEQGKSSLDAVSKTYLGDQKKYEGKYKNKVFPDKIEFNELKLIVEYCQLDCVLTKKIMEIWLTNFYNNFNFYPDRLYSAGYIGVNVLKTKLNEFPTFRKVPYCVNSLAYNAYFGGRFEITCKGYIENMHHYDIRSAYPYAMALMPDFNRGKWVKIYDVNDFKKYRDKVGFYKINVNVLEKNIAPFLFRGVHGEVLTPQGNFITHTTSMELDKALLYYDIDVKKLVGYCFIPDNNDETEFNKLIKEMYKKRMAQTNEGQKYVYKVIINSIYGKTAQSRPEPKGIFNPVCCSYITGHTRSMILDAVKDNKKDIKMIATDGIFSTEKLTKLKISDQLGDYEYKFHPKFILIMAGIYSYNSEKNEVMKVKNRGFGLTCYSEPDKDNIRKSWQFDLDQYTMVQKDDKFYYKIINMRPVAISTALIQDKYTENDIGKMEFIPKEIDINGDHKRNWFKRIRNIYDFSSSQCITLK